LKVFCVGNNDYWEHRFKPKDDALPFLSLSCIPDVRRYCISIVAESQLRAANEYMRNAVPELLGSVKLWVQSSAGGFSFERRKAIRNAIDEIEDQFKKVSV
jgi:hypothetical protein